MKYILLLFASGIVSLASFSQQNEIADWQKKHPHVLFVEQADYTPEFKAQLESFNREVIVYNGEITMDGIEAYASEVYEKTTIYSVERIDEANEIKAWLGTNPDVKVITRSAFNAQAQEEQNILLESSSMILQGEKITLRDIENYEATH